MSGRRQPGTAILCLLLAGAVGGCGNPAESTREATVEPAATPVVIDPAPSTGAGTSIMRPEVEAEVEPTPVPEVEPPVTPPTPTEATVLFPSGSAVLDEAARAVLEPVLADASRSPEITIRGHADALGSDRRNRLLSLARARAVRDYLASKGVAAEAMTIVGLGETRPVAPNANLDASDNPEGRQRNRRVVVVVAPPPTGPDEVEQAASPEVGPTKPD